MALILVKFGNISDSAIFCEIIVQRPITRMSMHLPSKMTEKDIEHMKVQAKEHFDKIMVVLKEMPKPLLLMIRYVRELLWGGWVNYYRFIVLNILR